MHLTCLSALHVPAFSELGYCDLNPLCNAYRLTEMMGFLNPMNRIWNIPFCSTNTCKGVDAYTHTHTSTWSPPKQSDKAALSEKKGARRERGGGGLLCDNGFHQIPPLSQIKMPAWRALAIFLFICLLIFFSFAECHRISGPIYCHRPAEHTRRSQPQSDRPLSYSPHR